MNRNEICTDKIDSYSSQVVEFSRGKDSHSTRIKKVYSHQSRSLESSILAILNARKQSNAIAILNACKQRNAKAHIICQHILLRLFQSSNLKCNDIQRITVSYLNTGQSTIQNGLAVALES
jgi:hypothetical protein